MISSSQYLKQHVEKRRFVAVLDDYFPNLLSAFRVAEYNWYMECFPRLKILSTNADFKTVHAAYAKQYPQYADRVEPYEYSSLYDCEFAYINFLNNAHHFLPALNAHCIPFIMTLYPGGGFGLREPASDAKLNKVLQSPLLRGVIATQSVTMEYLQAKHCAVPVHYMYGGVIHPLYFEQINIDKDTLVPGNVISICFVAARYMPKGANKGFPEFIAAAKQLNEEFRNLRFSVVGNFTAEDASIDDKVISSILFKGPLATSELKEFFLTQDIIISPNRPFLLHPGNFDGFPTGCCVEASLCGVAMVCSDELRLNHHYTNGIDIVICEPKPEALFKAVKELIRNPDLLMNIRNNGRNVSHEIFHPKKQLEKRSELLEKSFNHNEDKWPIKLMARLKMTEHMLMLQSDYIQGIENELDERRQNIAALEQIISDQTNKISSVEADWKACGQYITTLEKGLTDLANRNHDVETILAKKSWYGKLRFVFKKLQQLL